MNTSACILLEYCFHVFRYIPRDRISGSYGSSSLVFLGTSILFFHSDAVYIPNKFTYFFIFISSLFVVCRILMIAIWTGVMCYLTVCLDLHSLIICNVEHIFMCLLPIYMSSLKKKSILPTYFIESFFNINLYEPFIYFVY